MAIALTLLAVLTFSLFPLMLVASGSVESPFYFSAALRLERPVTYSVCLMTYYRRLLADPAVRKILLRRLLGWGLVAALTERFDVVLYALSAHYIDIAITRILFETWPLPPLVLMYLLLRDG